MAIHRAGIGALIVVLAALSGCSANRGESTMNEDCVGCSTGEPAPVGASAQVQCAVDSTTPTTTNSQVSEITSDGGLVATVDAGSPAQGGCVPVSVSIGAIAASAANTSNGVITGAGLLGGPDPGRGTANSGATVSGLNGGAIGDGPINGAAGNAGDLPWGTAGGSVAAGTVGNFDAGLAINPISPNFP